MSNGHLDKVQKSVEEAQKQRDWYRNLVKEQEIAANLDPAGYQRRLQRMMWMAYAYLYAVIVAVTLTIAGMIWFFVSDHSFNLNGAKLLFVLGVFLLAILRSLWVKFETPQGLAVEPGSLPKLEAVVNRVAGEVGAPAPYRIILDTEINAAAANIPRFGIFGGSRTMLVLGVPLLLGLSPAQAESVIAHEFGHFSLNHAAFGAKVYRFFSTWSQLMANLEGGHGRGQWVFYPIVHWLMPRFAASSVALRRANEFEADAQAARIAGAEAAGTALLRLPILSQHMDRQFWSDVHKQIRLFERPPQGQFRAIPDALSSPVDAKFAHIALRGALAKKTDLEDSHPSLQERLRALGVSSDRTVDELMQTPRPSAAYEWLGPQVEHILDRLSDLDKLAHGESWVEAHVESKKQLAELATLREKWSDGTLTADEAPELLGLIAWESDSTTAIPIAEQLIEAFPNSAQLNFVTGSMLLEEDDRRGLAYLDRALELDPECFTVVQIKRVEFHESHGEYEESEQLIASVQGRFDQSQVIEELALKVTEKDTFIKSQMKEEYKAKALESLSKIPKCDRVYAVSHELDPSLPVANYLIIFMKKENFKFEREPQEILEEITRDLPYLGQVYFLMPKAWKSWQKNLDTVPDSLLYDASATA